MYRHLVNEIYQICDLALALTFKVFGCFWKFSVVFGI